MRKLHLQVIHTADDDGSNAASITAEGVATLVNTANTIYAPAEVEFVFDPAKDMTHINSTLLNRNFTPLEILNKATNPDKMPATSEVPNKRAIRAIADLYRDRIVVFFSKRSKLVFDTAKGHWTMVGTNTSSSAWNAECVRMVSNPSGSVLAHELGHFLQVPHTFGKTPDSVSAAATAIRDYVKAGHAKSEGLNVFDGDGSWVTDTPPDAGTGIFSAVNGSKCSTQSSVDIKVDFADGSSQTYALTPDRSNLMSYFGCTGLSKPIGLSAQQIRRVQDAIDVGLRNRLVAKSGAQLSGLLVRGGDATDDVAISDLATVALGNGQVLTAMRASSGKLRLVSWNVSSNAGSVQRLKSAEGGDVSAVSACYVGLGLVATPVKTASGALKIILWKVDAAGNIVRKGDISDEAIGSALSTSRLGRGLLSTAVISGSGALRLQTWRVLPGGTISLLGTASAGAVSALALAESWALSVADDGDDFVDYAQLVTAVRDSSGALKMIQWGIQDDGKTIKRLSDAEAGNVGAVSLCALPMRTMVSAVQDEVGSLKLINWSLGEGSFGVDRWSSVGAGAVREIASCVAGVDLVATAVRTEPGKLKLIVWRSLADGAELARLADAEAGDASKVTVCQAAPGVLATAVRTGTGSAKLIAWNLS